MGEGRNGLFAVYQGTPIPTQRLPSTVSCYEHALKWLPSAEPSGEQLNDAVMRMREKGLKATGCNSAIRAINAYLKWSGSSLKIHQLKEPRLVLPTFTPKQVRLLVTWKAKGRYDRRLHLLVLFLLDTGCRITEALTLRVADLDMDNLLVTLDGKGRKQRVVPFSFELRKHYFATFGTLSGRMMTCFSLRVRTQGPRS